jgi:hypothetical protein
VEFCLSSQNRAYDRQVFDQRQKEKEAAQMVLQNLRQNLWLRISKRLFDQQEEEKRREIERQQREMAEIAELRKQIVHKANKIRSFK